MADGRWPLLTCLGDFQNLSRLTVWVYAKPTWNLANDFYNLVSLSQVLRLPQLARAER